MRLVLASLIDLRAMARFLSAEWFAEIDREAPAQSAQDAGKEPQLVLEQVVRNTPDGEVRYRVLAGGGVARIVPGPPPNGGSYTPDLIITCDWATAAAIAQGHLSAQAALMAGRLRVRGSLHRLSGWAPDLVGLDPVPASVRRRTTY